jgi:hypothetical protein
MPESRVRRQTPFTPPPAKAAPPKPNPRWYVPLMVGLLLVGLAYLVVTYLSNFDYPIGAIGYWNLGIGFGILMLGFGMTTRWR